MKKVMLGVVVSCLCASLTLLAQGSKTFTGEIMDSQCAKMGSHEHMMKMHTDVKTSKQCTLACVKMGGKFVLFDPATKTVYQLDDQQKTMAFAGEQVKIMGSLNASTNTIHVTSITKAS